MVEEMLNRLAEVSFKIYEVYQELIELDGKVHKNEDYEEKRKLIVGKLAVLRVTEDDIYEELRNNPSLSAACLYYFESRKSDVTNVNEGVQALDITKSYSIVQQRIKCQLENICMENRSVTTDLGNNPLVAYLRLKDPEMDIKEIIRMVVKLQNKFATNLTIKSCIYIDDFLEDNENEELVDRLTLRKYLRTFINRDVEEDFANNKYACYSKKLNEEYKNEFGIDEDVIKLFYGNLATKMISSSVGVLFNCDVNEASINLAFDIQGALLYLDDDDLKLLFVVLLTLDASNDLFKGMILSSIKEIDNKKKFFNKDLNKDKEI